ncbi:hypothetical protein J4E83_000903 [Alternaria metachromatica]|uniref:uncharacterized protein n=1 Tax=Alternaria metachromatica TaxID=283354 RepID=UPI0020C308A3|nr:uncharacterized protein J4E83_000903 [Alternaria metachromatica]KAI4635949.1 hypothetical protein J4E83_000903 [Alternaria metachromatica]
MPTSRRVADIIIPQDAAPPEQGPNETSYFFNLLNRDVRNLIYNYMTLGQIRTKDATQWVGFRGTCRQAKQEAEEEGVRHLWLYVQDICRRFTKSTGYRLRLPHQLKNMEDFAGLTELTLITNAPVHLVDLRKDRYPRTGVEDLLSIEINNIVLHYTSQQVVKNLEDMTEAAVLMLMGLESGIDRSPSRLDTDEFFAGTITVSWDYRNCTREDEYESLPTYQLKRELRNRGVASAEIPERKPAVIDALLLHDSRNPQTIAPTTPRPATNVPQVLLGKRFYTVEVDGSLDTMEFEGDIPPFHADTNLFSPGTSRFYADTSLFYATNRRSSVGMVRLDEIHHRFGGGMWDSLWEVAWDDVRKAREQWDYVPVQVCWTGIKYD